MAYAMCRHIGCFHFVEENPCYGPFPNPSEGTFTDVCEYVHLDDGEKDHDHEAEPGRAQSLAEWRVEMPELFHEYPDGKVGPNSSYFRDAHALDEIARLLEADEWRGADFLEAIGVTVRVTGRSF